MSSQKEIRYFKTQEMRAVNDDKRTIEGYAAVFNSASSPLLGFTEYCKPGCFTRAIAEQQDVRFLMNHDPNLLMGRTKNGTLRLMEDDHGLKFQCDLPDTQAARDMYTLVKRGDMDQCSFSFIPQKDKWGKEKNSAGDWQASRDLLDVDLLDASAVTYPCYEETEVNARALFPQGVPAEVRSAIQEIKTMKQVTVSKRDVILSLEDVICAINCALLEKFGCNPGGWQQHYSIETYPDHVISCTLDCEPNGGCTQCYFSIPWSMDGEGCIVIGDPTPVEQAWVPCERTKTLADAALARGKALIAEKRGFPDVCTTENAQDKGMQSGTPTDLVAAWVKAYNDAYETAVKAGDDKDNPKAAAATALAAANKAIDSSPSLVPLETNGAVGKANPSELNDGSRTVAMDTVTSTRGIKMDHGYDCDCDDPNCPCQNRSVDMDDVDYWGDDLDQVNGGDDDMDEDDQDGDSDDERSRKVAKRTAIAKRSQDAKVKKIKELRDAGTTQVLTKRVAGKNLSKGAFAFVGDPKDTTTWKLPIMDKAHAQNALARFNQTQGIPADQKDAVLAKIKAAAKKFGINTSESNSLQEVEHNAERQRELDLMRVKLALADMN
jgi:HK97 family phage prohead protease